MLVFSKQILAALLQHALSHFWAAPVALTSSVQCPLSPEAFWCSQQECPAPGHCLLHHVTRSWPDCWSSHAAQTPLSHARTHLFSWHMAWDTWRSVATGLNSSLWHIMGSILWVFWKVSWKGGIRHLPFLSKTPEGKTYTQVAGRGAADSRHQWKSCVETRVMLGQAGDAEDSGAYSHGPELSNHSFVWKKSTLLKVQDIFGWTYPG